MRHALLLMLAGAGLIVVGIARGGWAWLAAWLGGSLLALGVAHVRGAHRVLGKGPDGTIAISSRVLHAPYFVLSGSFWWLTRWLSREPAFTVVSDDLVIGRRLLPGEVPGTFANYLDLTAEFAEPAPIRCRDGYHCVPLLDGAAPPPGVLVDVIATLRPGRTYVHCAQGHGRSALVAVAWLLAHGRHDSVDSALGAMIALRPRVHLTPAQRRCLNACAECLVTGHQVALGAPAQRRPLPCGQAGSRNPAGDHPEPGTSG
jgi:hypothetical protein